MYIQKMLHDCSRDKPNCTKKITLSIVIPVYNAGQALQKNLDYLCSLSNNNIEIICIDDASSNNTVEIIKKYLNDPRIILIEHSKNLGVHIARIEGINKASGKYIWLIDDDDLIIQDSINKLCALAQKLNYDIIHFSSSITNIGFVENHRIKQMEEFIKPYPGKLFNENIFKKCFIEKKYGFNIWNKLFLGNFLKSITTEFELVNIPKAQDKYEYYVISHKAKSYLGYTEINAYNYNFGAGISGRTSLSLELFSKYADMSIASNAIDSYSAKYPSLKTASIIAHTDLLEDCINNWFRVKIEDRSQCFDKMVDNWGTVAIISALARRSWYNTEEISKSIYHSKHICLPSNKIKTIATYYHRLNNGGIQRVIPTLINIWISIGYKVILITDESPSNEDYIINPSVDRVVIPHYIATDRNNYIVRSKKLAEILIENHVDIFINHAWVVNTLFWDLLTCKINNVKYLTVCHNISPMLMGNGQLSFSSLPYTYRLMDGIITLNEVDYSFWSFFNKNVFHIQNPITFNPYIIKRSNLNGEILLWVGRFSNEKRPMDALTIFSKLKSQHPDLKLIMVGSGSEKITKSLLKYIRKNKLGNSVQLTGYTKNVEDYYQIATIVLITSEYEGFLLTLSEALSFGIPTVLYELPYLSIVQNGAGFIQVPQNNKDLAASTISMLLKDKHKRELLSKQGYDYSKKMYEYPHEEKWQHILKTIEQEYSTHFPLADYENMWNTILLFYKKGVIKTKRGITDSTTYKVGKLITTVPKKIYNFLFNK